MVQRTRSTSPNVLSEVQGRVLPGKVAREDVRVSTEKADVYTLQKGQCSTDEHILANPSWAKPPTESSRTRRSHTGSPGSKSDNLAPLPNWRYSNSRNRKLAMLPGDNEFRAATCNSPYCLIFTSRDGLHRETTQQWVRPPPPFEVHVFHLNKGPA
jgi:hypothetical protein